MLSTFTINDFMCLVEVSLLSMHFFLNNLTSFVNSIRFHVMGLQKFQVSLESSDVY